MLAGILVAALAAPSAAKALQWRGVQVSPYWANQPPRELERQLDLAAGAGANLVRVNLSWSSLQEGSASEHSRWYVARADALFAAAARRGLRVAPNLWSSPCWASSAPSHLKRGCEGEWWKRDVSYYPPTDPRDYARIAGWVTRRWGGGMAGLEIWNEPDHRYLVSDDQARDYARLVRAAYPAIKTERPSLTVIAGATAGANAEFVRELYRHGVRGHLDALSIHPYSGDRPASATATGGDRRWSMASGVPWVRQVMLANGDTSPMWLSEFGWATCQDRGDRCVDERTQAEFTRSAWKTIAGFGYVLGASQYSMRDNGSDPRSREENFGLLRDDLSPKPALGALRGALGGAPAGTPFSVGVRSRAHDLRSALSRGVKVFVSCSHRCRVRARVTRVGHRAAGRGPTTTAVVARGSRSELVVRLGRRARTLAPRGRVLRVRLVIATVSSPTRTQRRTLLVRLR